jgi:hypothetical protein
MREMKREEEEAVGVMVEMMLAVWRSTWEVKSGAESKARSAESRAVGEERYSSVGESVSGSSWWWIIAVQRTHKVRGERDVVS